MTTRREHFSKRLGQLELELANWTPHWQDLARAINPRTARFLTADRQGQGNKRQANIYDNTATIALRTLESGMMSGVTSPARPWFQFTTPDRGLNESHAVRGWMEAAKDVCLSVMLRSNFYTSIPDIYSALGCYGTGAFSLLEDTRATLRTAALPIGSYMLGTDDTGRVDSCYRRFEMSVGQLVRKFGRENCTDSVRSMYDRGTTEHWVQVCHAVEPNIDWDDQKVDSKFKQYLSVYWEHGATGDTFLSEKGFDEFPIIAPRWAVTGEDVYGTSPGMLALGDIKGLQLKQKRKLQGLDKLVNPPMTGPTSLRNKRSSVLPGDTTYVDEMGTGQRFQPAYQIQIPFAELGEDIRQDQQRIDTAFFKDLFLMFANEDRSDVTAFEIAKRSEEKLMALGPVYLRLNDEMLDPAVERVFWMCMRAGLMPAPPPELQGMPLQVEYISVMAQAMKAIGVASIERVMTFAGNMGQAFPDVMDRINADRAFVHYADMSGAPSDILFDDAAVAQARAQRAQMQQAQQAMAMAQQGASTAKDLSGASLSDNNALSQLAARMQGAAPAQGA